MTSYRGRDTAIDETLTTVGNVSEFADSIELDEVLTDCGLQELRVEFSDTVDLARPWNGSQFGGLGEETGKPHR